jgi:hypothetical protein
MWERTSVGAAGVLVASALMLALGGARAADEGKYPDLHGGWQRFVIRALGGQPSFDQTKPWGFGQQAPLTAEYRKVLEESLADQATGGQGNFIGHAQCLPAGMPFMMVATRPLDIVVTPYSTYVLVGGNDHYRRIYTDGRDWPREIEPTYSGYSIGRWIDSDGDGRYDVLEVETRGFKGPRAYDASGLPLDFDNQSIFKERIYVDRTDPNLLHDEFTVIDHALTRPWAVDKRYIRRPNPHPEWVETYCTEGTALVFIGNEAYYVSGDGKLMPTKKDQPAPDLSYFKQKRP